MDAMMDGGRKRGTTGGCWGELDAAFAPTSGTVYLLRLAPPAHRP
jgi:hypothetical protein